MPVLRRGLLLLLAPVIVATALPGAGEEGDAFEGLPFRIREPARLVIESQLRDSILLTRPGRPRDAGLTEPFLIVAPSEGPRNLEDIEAFARWRLLRTAKISRIRMVRGHAIRIAERPAWELLAEAVETATGQRLRLYQVVVEDGEDYVLIQGVAGAERFEDFLPEFRSVARSLELR